MSDDAPDAADEELLARSAAGDRLAFDRLAARHLARIYRIAYRLLGHAADAEEVTQEALVRVWQHADRFDRHRAKFSTWCYRIVVNLALTLKRRPAPEPIEAASELADTAADPEIAAEDRERRHALERALQNLPDRQRAALALVYDEELSGEEAAVILEISPRALEGLLRRGRQSLREWLAQR